MFWPLLFSCSLPLLVQLSILAATLLGCTGGLFLLDLADYARPALLAVEQVVDLLGEQLARVFAVLASRPGGLGLDDYARRDMFQLDCRVGLVLWAWG